MKNSSFTAFLLLIVFSLFTVPTSSCLNDTRCADCNSYLILIGFSMFLYYNCDQCTANSALNPQTNLCECSLGYYSGPNSCVKCSALCATCTN